MATKITDFAATGRLWNSIAPQGASPGEVVGDSVDMLQADGPAFAILSVGEDIADATIDGSLQASDDGDNWVSVDGVGFAEQGGSGVRAITFQRTKRYLRVVLSIHDADDPVTLAVMIGQSRKVL